MKPTETTKEARVTTEAERLVNVAVHGESYKERIDARVEIIKQLNERERLREALRDLVECSPCQNGCAPDDMTCATMKARAALNEADGVEG